MKLTKSIGFAFAASVLSLSAIAHADMYSSLSADDQAKVDAGQQAVPAPISVTGSVWPQVTIYQKVQASPEQAAAVMFDYALHKTMFAPTLDASGTVTKPGITLSTPAANDAGTTTIDYEMVLPKVLGISLPAETYTVSDVLSSYGSSSYKISWTFVKAASMKDTHGVVQFEPLPGGYVLIGYTNFISPPLPTVAKLIVKMYVQQVQDTVTSLIGQITNERNASDRSQLNTQLTRFNHALGH